MAKDNNWMYWIIGGVAVIGGLFYLYSDAGLPLRRQIVGAIDPSFLQASSNFGAWQRA